MSVNIEQFWLFHCGYMQLPRWMTVRGGGSKKVRLPFLAAILVHPELGPILIDAPFGAEGPSNVGEVLGGILRRTGLVFRDEWAVVPRVERLGFRASEVNHILMTHMHFDHTGGMKSLGHAKFHINRDEWVQATSLAPFAAMTKGYVVDDYRALSSHVEKLDLSDATLDAGLDVFGDGSVHAIPLPGHSPGHTGFMVHLEDRDIFFVGDAGFEVSHLTGEHELGVFPKAAADDRTLAKQTLAQIQDWQARHPDVQLLTAHDVGLGELCMNGPSPIHSST